MTDRGLGMRWGRSDPTPTREARPSSFDLRRNTRTSLWPNRWPAIALQECIDKVEAAPPEEQVEVKRNLPCQVCPKNTSCLNAKRKEIGPLMYSREELTMPRSSESSLFPKELVDPMKAHGEPLVPYWRKPLGVEHEYVVVQAWDLAWSEKVGGDWLVFMCGYLNVRSGRRRLLDVQRWQQLSFQQQIDMIRRKWGEYDADLVVIESDAAQKIWTQQVAGTTPVPVLGHAAGEDKTSLATGVPSLLIDFENRRWEFPWLEGTYHHDEIVTFFDELEAFGWVDGKLQGVGEHDDTVMAFWHLAWGMTKYAREGVSELRRGTQPGREI